MYRKDHYAIAAAASHDTEAFCRGRSNIVALLPSLTSLAALTIRQDASRAHERAKTLARELTARGEGRVLVLGPALAPIGRLRGLFRFQILLKAKGRRRLGATLARALGELRDARGGTRDLIVDVDPIQLL